MSRTAPTSYRFGMQAESWACLALRLKGYRILARRYKTPVGEIDIIARKRQQLVFVEVKARRRPADALQAVTPAMKKRIVRAAGHYMAMTPSFAGFSMRFDLMALAPPFFIRHLDNAWRPDT